LEKTTREARMSNIADNEGSISTGHQYRVHRYEVALISMKDVAASSPAEAIRRCEPDLSKIIDRTFNDHDSVTSIKYPHLKPISFIVEPIDDGLPDYRSLAHYAEDLNGNIYRLQEPFTSRSEEASRLVDRIADISPDALNSKNYGSVLMAIIREAKSIHQRHSAQK
jgi:hypothetical protein